MRLTFAVAFATHLMPVFNDLRSPNLLTAFPFPKTMELVTYSPEYLIMDSGAFSAWTVGEEIDIDAYIEWVKMNQKKFPRTIAINLDVIPGERGRMATKEERNAGMRESIKNADYIRNAGVANVMEVFHQFEPREFLDELLDRLPPGGILGLSPRNDAPVAVKMGWVDSVLAHLVKRFGKENLPGFMVWELHLPRCFNSSPITLLIRLPGHQDLDSALTSMNGARQSLRPILGSRLRSPNRKHS